jgi:hypothetical protein
VSDEEITDRVFLVCIWSAMFVFTAAIWAVLIWLSI